MKLREGARRRCTSAAALAAVGFAFAASAGAQERVQIPGTSVTLTAPPGFAVARGARGLENAATGSSITIAERSADAYSELALLFTSPKSLSASYASQGVTIRSVRQIGVGTERVPFASGRQVARGTEVAKYLALLKGGKTVLITFTIADRGFTEADAEALVSSVTIAPAPTLEEQLAALSFTFSVVEPFRIDELSRTTATLASGEGEDAPVVVIGRVATRNLMGDEPRIAAELLKSTAGFRDAEVTAEGPALFAGGNGYVVTAVVAERTVVQYLRILPGGSHLRLVARGETSAMQAAEAAIAKIAGSVGLD